MDRHTRMGTAVKRIVFPGDVVIHTRKPDGDDRIYFVLWSTPHCDDAESETVSLPRGSFALVLGIVPKGYQRDITGTWYYVMCGAGYGWSQSMHWKRVTM